MKILTLLLVLLISGCTPNTIYVDRPIEVYVPIKCKVPEVPKAILGKSDAETLLNILEYKDKLRKASKYCQ